MDETNLDEVSKSKLNIILRALYLWNKKYNSGEYITASVVGDDLSCNNEYYREENSVKINLFYPKGIVKKEQP